MSAAICTLLEHGWIPSGPTAWTPKELVDTTGSQEDQGTRMEIVIDVSANSVDRTIAMHTFRSDVDDGVWANRKHGGELDNLTCTPCFQAAHTVHRSYRNNDSGKADCLAAVAQGNVWAAARANPQNLAKQGCSRCNAPLEDETCRFYTCPDNRNADGPSVIYTNYLIRKAEGNPDDPMWTRRHYARANASTQTHMATTLALYDIHHTRSIGPSRKTWTCWARWCRRRNVQAPQIQARMGKVQE